MEIPALKRLSNDVAATAQEAIDGASESVRNGSTLPPRAYASEAFFELERDAIFRREWLLVGHISQVAEPGDYFTINLLDEPIVVVRGKDGKVRALSTVCRHRWAPVAQGAGNTPAFSCPFHKWTYALDGQLIGAPLMEQADGFDRKACRLPEFRSEVVEALGLIFVTFSPDIEPISDRLASLSARAQAEGWDLKDQVVLQKIDQSNNYNWKVQVETYVECYHHIGGHEVTLEKFMPARLSGCEEDHGSWTMCIPRLADDTIPLTPVERQVRDALANGVKPGEPVGHIVVIYPFTLLTFMQGGCDIRVLEPTSAGTTRSVLMVTGSAEHAASPGLGAWLESFNATANLVNDEDNALNDMQQIGVASAFAEPGRFSHLESSAWDLAQYVRRRIGEYRAANGGVAAADAIL